MTLKRTVYVTVRIVLYSGLFTVKYAWTYSQGVSFYIFFAQDACTNGNAFWNLSLINPDMNLNSCLSFTGVLFLQMASAVSHSTVFVIYGKSKVNLAHLLFFNHIPGYLSVSLTIVQDLMFLQQCSGMLTFQRWKVSVYI